MMDVHKNCAEWLIRLLSSQSVTLPGAELDNAFHIKMWLQKIRSGELMLIEAQVDEGQT